MMKHLQRSYIGLVMIFLYLPIAVLILYSFNASKSRSVWAGFSLRWYRDLFSNQLILTSLYNTTAGTEPGLSDPGHRPRHLLHPLRHPQRAAQAAPDG